MNRDCLSSASGIYGVRNSKTGKWYVGSAVSIRRRVSSHVHALRMGIHHSSKFQRAWAKHGESAFVFMVLEICEKEQLLEREQFWIDNRGAYATGYNAQPLARSSLGLKRSAETRAKVSAAVKKLSSDPQVKERQSQRSKAWMAIPENRAKLGHAIKSAYAAKTADEMSAIRASHAESMKNPAVRAKLSASSRGRRASEETRRRQSEAKRGVIQSEATRAKRSATLKGHAVSQETREKIRKANLGRKPTEEQLEKMRQWHQRNPMVGRIVSDETKARISAAVVGKTKGKKKSAETKERIRLAALRRYRGADYVERQQ